MVTLNFPAQIHHFLAVQQWKRIAADVAVNSCHQTPSQMHQAMYSTACNLHVPNDVLNTQLAMLSRYKSFMQQKARVDTHCTCTYMTGIKPVCKKAVSPCTCTCKYSSHHVHVSTHLITAEVTCTQFPSSQK